MPVDFPRDLPTQPLPYPAEAWLKTVKTSETSSVSNNEFMDALFWALPDHARPMAVSFSGNPANAPSWTGEGWRGDSHYFDPSANNYFSIASFKPDKNGQLRRRKEQFCALHVVTLDDVGTKVDPSAVKLSPSYIIETSEGNYQYGYILAAPITSAEEADRLFKAIISVELCDAGAGGPTARIMRLPVGVNGKYTPIFQCQLREWNPERRFTIQQLIGGLGLDMSKPVKNQNKAQTARLLNEGETIYVPRPQENRVLAELKKRELYKANLGDGKHDITCPWCHEHTGEVDGGTGYFEPDQNFSIGGFHCFHGHCEGRNIHSLLEFLGLSVADTRMKPTIRVVQGEIHHIVECAEKELAATGRYFQRGGTISTVKRDPTTQEITIKPLPKNALVSTLSSVAVWEKFDSRAGGRIKCDPPERVCMALDGAEEYRHLPVLNGIAHQPYLREDGSLATVSGYDAATGMYGAFKAEKFSVPEQPTEAQARYALGQLQGIFEEFAFKDESDRSAALCAMLTAVIRSSLPLAPMFHVKAPQISSGKSYMCRIIGGFASSQIGTPTTFPHDDEECRKLLLAELMRGVAVIEFDNLTGDLVAHKSLCTALTSEYTSGRILGVSKTVSVSTRTLFLSSGNNVGPIQDMARRCITINLDPACEIPAARTFKNPDLLRTLYQRREEYVSYALTIIRAWIVSDKPKSECRTVASYGAWSDLCRQPLLWLGLPDPAHSLFNTIMDDPERELLGRFLEAWQDCLGSGSNMIRKALEFPSADSEKSKIFREIMQEIAGERDMQINRHRLGWWMKRNAGKIVSGRRLVNVKGSGSAAQWKVETVS
jgi:hypothetical protein